MPNPIIRDDGPAHLEATVVKSEADTVVHLVSFIPVRRAEGLDVVDSAVPVVGLNPQIRQDMAPARVTLQPEGRKLEFVYRDGYVHTNVSFTQGHAMVVLH